MREISVLKILNAGIAQLVERNLAKVDVAGSNPVSRSALRGRGWSVIAPDVPVNTLLFKSGHAAPNPTRWRGFFIRGRRSRKSQPLRRRTQVVRERSAKPLCTGSNPVVASNPTPEFPLHLFPRIRTMSRLCCVTLHRGLDDQRRPAGNRPEKLARAPENRAGVAKLVDAQDLKS